MAACLPYLLLSVLVDFVHLHPLFDVRAPQISATNHVAPCPTTKGYDAPCAICQWLRAGTGLQPSVAAGPAVVRLAGDVTAGLAVPCGSPARLPIAPRGPPASPLA